MDFDFTKALQSFDKLPFRKRMTSVFNLFKNTLTVIGRDEDIIKPFIRMLIYNLGMIGAFFYMIFRFWYDLPFVFIAFLIAFFLFLYKYFYYNKQEIRLSWIVYEAITGSDPSYKDAVKASKQMKPQIRKIAWMDIGMAFASKAKIAGKGIVNILINLALRGFGEAWDLINHYLLPSVAVDGEDIKPAIKKMKTLKDQVPETLIGVFGIDFLGKVVLRVVIPVYLFLIALSVGLGYLLKDSLPAADVDAITFSPFDSMELSWIPFFAALFIGKLFSNCFERLVNFIKVIYFTVFYTRLTHPERISEDLKAELTDYLQLDAVEEVENLNRQES